MKTLEEVIKAYEICTQEQNCVGCPYTETDINGKWACSLCGDCTRDAHQYLKWYKELADDSAVFAQWKENPPLTWYELRTMEGKPLWVVIDGKERWRIIREVTNELLMFESGLPLHKSWMNHTDGWQAYRKENV